MKNKKIKMLLLAIVLSISCFLTCFVTTNVVYASSIGVVGGYTNVLEDLQKDDTFNVEDYPVIQDDYTLQVITIAESTDKELFVYVYQPSANYGNLRATTINISKNLHNKTTFTNYKLALINSNGAFYKYVIKGISVESSSTRYYEISSIFRAWNSEYDEDTGNDNTISEVSFKVAKQFTLVGDGEDIVTSVADTEVITITDKYVGFCRYEDGYDLNAYNGGCDSHFVAFSTDKKIDKLYEADVYYTSQSYQYVRVFTIGGGAETTYGDVVDNYVYLDYTQNASFTTNGIGGHTYSWKRITSVSNFIANEDRDLIYECGIFNVNTETKMSDTSLQNLKDKQWVLRFADTDYKYVYTSSMQDIRKTIVADVTILRLSFETDGVVYNLGVVDNKQTGDSVPNNETNISLEMSDTFKILLMVMLLILLVVVLSPILPTLFSIILTILKVIFKIIIWLVTAPFKLIGKVFKKRE